MIRPLFERGRPIAEMSVGPSGRPTLVLYQDTLTTREAYDFFCWLKVSLRTAVETFERGATPEYDRPPLRYASDSNDRWYTKAQLQAIIREEGWL